MAKPDHTETSREDLAKPYYTLRGFKHFDITGIPEVLAKAVKQQVTSPKSAISPTVILAELEAMQAKGNEAWGSTMKEKPTTTGATPSTGCIIPSRII